MLGLFSYLEKNAVLVLAKCDEARMLERVRRKNCKFPIINADLNQENDERARELERVR